MKKTFLAVATMLVGVFVLAGCKAKPAAEAKPQQEDLSGDYFYVQEDKRLSDRSGNKNRIHKITLTTTDKTNKHYKIVEKGDLKTSNGTLKIVKKKMTFTFKTSSTDLDKADGGGYDLSESANVPFDFKNDVLTLGETEKVPFYGKSTKLGQQYQTIFTGRKTWHQVFKTPSPEKENTEEETTDDSEESTPSQVEFSNVQYNSQNGTLSLRVKNNTGQFIESIIVHGTLKYHEKNGYGEDEVSDTEFSTLNGGLGVSGLDANDETALEPIHHIEKDATKDFTFKLDVGDDPTVYSDPKIDASQNEINFRNKTPLTREWYQALPADYKMTTNTNAAGEIESVTITNTSDYQWEYVTVHHEFPQAFSDDFNYYNAQQSQVDKGATITINNLGGPHSSSHRHATRIMYVAFQPRYNH